MNRRTFLASTAAAGSMIGAARAAANPAPCPPSAWKKHGVSARHQGEPAGGWLQNFTSVSAPLDGDRWRLWTSVSGRGIPFNVGFAEGVPGEPMNKTWPRL